MQRILPNVHAFIAAVALLSLLATASRSAEELLGSLSVNTDPAGATIYVNGVPKGQRPCAVKDLGVGDYPNETAIVFQADGAAVCLLRRDGGPRTAKVGTAKPPYTKWTWKDLGVQIGGPHLLQLPDGRFIAAVRLYKPARTALCWLDPQAGKLTKFLTLPSGGDTSYAGLVWHEGLLWMSYYSSHKGKTSIYLAKVKLPGS